MYRMVIPAACAATKEERSENSLDVLGGTAV